MPDPPLYFSTASLKPRLSPSDLPFAIGVTASPDPGLPIGMAFPDGTIADEDHGHGQPEAAWRLVVGGREVAGRWALRNGEFVRLGDEG